MPLTPGYGETPLPHDELTALLPHVVEVLETNWDRTCHIGGPNYRHTLLSQNRLSHKRITNTQYFLMDNRDYPWT
jgi:hypothetical protein